MNIIDELEKLRRQHVDCEDPRYSCPKSPDGCIHEGAGDECNCGADAHNYILDGVIASITHDGFILNLESVPIRGVDVGQVKSGIAAASPEGFVQSPNCIGGCTSLYGGLCGPCYRLNRHKPA